MTTYGRGPYRFDTAQMMPDVTELLDHLGVTVPLVPFDGLLQPKFVHGILGALYSGVQAVDLLLDGEVMGGRCMLPRRSVRSLAR